MINEIINNAINLNASDIHLCINSQPFLRINGNITVLENFPILNKQNIQEIVNSLCTKDQIESLNRNKNINFSYSIAGKGRFRVNAFYQRGSISITARILNYNIPNMNELGLPQTLKDLIKKKNGLILVTGPTGSGKSTTLTSVINEINETERKHILTIEDPIEYLHQNKKSIINQREVGTDVNNFSDALRVALRQDPDVILIGEMRDLETIQIALTAAETGHLVLATLHTTNAPSTIDRIVDVFPSSQQQQIKVQLADVLQGIISQRLVTTIDNKRTLALEILINNQAIKNLIREGKTHQIYNTMQTNLDLGMVKMEQSLKRLYDQKKISFNTLNSHY